MRPSRDELKAEADFLLGVNSKQLRHYYFGETVKERGRVKAKASEKYAEACVYVIGAPGQPVKVGMAVDVESRLSSIQTGYPHKLHVYGGMVVGYRYAKAVEKRTHTILSAKRLHGEWFDVEPHQALGAIDQAVKIFANVHSDKADWVAPSPLEK